MNILTLENRGSVSFYMTDYLQKEGHEVFDAYNTGDAQSIWESDNYRIDCMIVDLNVIPVGFSTEQKKRSQDGLLAGWVWLSDYVLTKDATMRKRTIIYSRYINDLREDVGDEKLEGIRLVPKSDSASTAEQIIRHIQAIDNMLERKRNG
ncbi:hypothetical protein CEE37_09775 [candidate division LCP-89 bacterium B3_LCP]|uniref:Response regulatory domain-containing protein n=1 Tax=candidate division LCP-89 bacterium B3_LCP TaxID=2012998 RepID=A0A532UYI7_UNCL8|nr:MAG: hypothetical protein CEE37_09775 [candidate division LCP-89 bacterium B3_LCP]